MRVDTSAFDVRAVIYAIKDYSSNVGKISYTVCGDAYEIELDAHNEKVFCDLLNDYILRIRVAEETKHIKEMIIQRALFDIVED